MKRLAIILGVLVALAAVAAGGLVLADRGQGAGDEDGPAAPVSDLFRTNPIETLFGGSRCAGDASDEATDSASDNADETGQAQGGKSKRSCGDSAADDDSSSADERGDDRSDEGGAGEEGGRDDEGGGDEGGGNND